MPQIISFLLVTKLMTPKENGKANSYWLWLKNKKAQYIKDK